MNEQRDKKRLQQFGTNLKSIRERLNLSQDDVAARCDVTKGNLSNIENGKKDFNYTTLLEIAKGLEVHPKDLLDFGIDFTEGEINYGADVTRQVNAFSNLTKKNKHSR